MKNRQVETRFASDIDVLSSLDRGSVQVSVREESDVAIARMYVRQLAPQAGLSKSSTDALAIAVSEIAHNIIVHASVGDLTMRVVDEPNRRGVIVVARDAGPGIPDLDWAMQDGHSTAVGLGLGLSSAQRLVDDFNVASATGDGTTVTLKKWAS